MRYDRLYIPPPERTPWPLRPIQRAGGLTFVGIAVALLLSFPVVGAGILLAWEVFGP